MTIDPHTTPEAVSTQIIERAAGVLRDRRPPTPVLQVPAYPKVTVSWDDLDGVKAPIELPELAMVEQSNGAWAIFDQVDNRRYQCCRHCAGDHTQVKATNDHKSPCVIGCRKGLRRAGKPFIECDTSDGHECWIIWPAGGGRGLYERWRGPLGEVIDSYLADAARGR